MLHWFAKRLRQIQEMKWDERGFTLIELLVVVTLHLHKRSRRSYYHPGLQPN